MAREGGPRFFCSLGGGARKTIAELQSAFRRRRRTLFASHPSYAWNPAGSHLQSRHIAPAKTMKRDAPFHDLGSCRAFFENIIVNRIYSSKRLPSYIGTGHTDSKGLFHAYHQLERVN